MRPAAHRGSVLALSVRSNARRAGMVDAVTGDSSELPSSSIDDMDTSDCDSKNSPSTWGALGWAAGSTLRLPAGTSDAPRPGAVAARDHRGRDGGPIDRDLADAENGSEASTDVLDVVRWYGVGLDGGDEESVACSGGDDDDVGSPSHAPRYVIGVVGGRERAEFQGASTPDLGMYIAYE